MTSSDMDKEGLNLLPIFDGKPKDWPAWRERFESILDINDMLDVLLPGAARPTNAGAEQRKWDKTNRNIYARLILRTAGTPLGLVKQHKAERDGLEAWKALLAKYEQKGEVKMSSLHEQLINTSMKASEDPESYFLKLEEIREKLKELDVTIEDNTLKGIATARMPSEYAPLRTVVDTIKDLSYDGLKEHVKAFYDRNIDGQWKPADAEDALITQHKLKCVRCDKFGHVKHECPNLFNGKCFRCGKTGHKK